MIGVRWRMPRVAGWLVAAAALGGCPTSRMVVLTTAADPGRPAGCVARCAHAFGGQATGCEDRAADTRCSYDQQPPPLPTRALDDAACRAACAAAGLPRVDGCEAMVSLAGEPVVACAYRVGYH